MIKGLALSSEMWRYFVWNWVNCESPAANIESNCCQLTLSIL